MKISLSESYAACEALSRREAGNFYHAFRVLPRPQRRAMCALYAFMRIADDLGDDPGSTSAKRAALAKYRTDFHSCLAGDYTRELHPALHDTILSYSVPTEYLEAVLDGIEMDLEGATYQTFAELYRYCYRVASAVGLCCIHIWGYRGEEAKLYAEKAGIAFQLTNILRDLAEDAGRDRVYLPREDLERFGYDRTQLERGEKGRNFQALMRFEADRARGFYAESEPLCRHLPAPGRAVFQVMFRTYRGLLDEIVARDFDVFRERIGLSRWRKWTLVLRAVPVRFGWSS